MRKTIAIATALTLTLAACSSSSDPDPQAADPGFDVAARIEQIRRQSTEGSIEFVSFLRPVGDCAAVLAHLRAEAAGRVGPYGLPGTGYYGPMFAADGDMATSGRAAEAAPTAAGEGGADAYAQGSGGDDAGNYSGTNNQETGVDEPDFVKTDGERIITITDNRLSVVPIDAGKTGAVRSVKLGNDNFYPSDLLIVGDRALVFGNGWLSVDDSQGDSARPGIASSSSYYPGGGLNMATVTEVDLSGTGDPVVGSTLRVEGSTLTSRLIGNTVRLVVRSDPNQLDFVYPQNQNGEQRAQEANEDVILDSTIDDWLPNYQLVDADGSVAADGVLGDCNRIEAPTDFAGFGSLSVLTFDITAPLTNGDPTTVLAGGDTVYASDSSLYVSTQTWVDVEQDESKRPWWPQVDENYATSIHQFSIADTAPATYVGSGSVPGSLLNQFSMSEHEGILRVATTQGSPWNRSDDSESFITTLQLGGDTLTQVGQVGDMGKGERIYSVRYAGDVAYVVTFRQTDPFYTVDLADPAAPRVLGELKITGYSGYLHPIDDNLVIGVGQEASDEGRTQGTKVSLFDVADLANPTELGKWTLPDSNSGAEYDHHAFLYWPATKTLVLPVYDYRYGASARAVVLEVSRANGIVELGKVTHDIAEPADLGSSDCRRVTEEELANDEGGRPYIDGDMVIQVCESGDDGGAVGYDCSSYGEGELPKPEGGGVDIPEGSRVELCWPTWNNVQPIERSIVVGDHLWTASHQLLQANNLSTLEQTDRISL